MDAQVPCERCWVRLVGDGDGEEGDEGCVRILVARVSL